MLKTTVQKGNKHYFFETEETIKACPKCQREYVARKACLNCSKNGEGIVETVAKTKIREGRLSFDLTKFNCSCVFGSWHRWGAHWLNNHPKSICRHAKSAIRKINEEGNK